MKWLLRIGVVVVLLVVIAAVAAFILIDNIATAAVREGAAFATQTEVEVDGVDVSIFGASATISNLDIKNPDGVFRETHDSFLKLGTGGAEVSAGSIMSDKVVIPNVELTDIELSLIGKDGKKNYEAILESLKRFQGDGPPPEETEGGKKFGITLTTVSRITVHYDFDEDPALGALPVEGTLEIAFDEPLVFENLGEGGVPMSQITADLITDILFQVTANMGEQLGDHVLGLGSSLLDTVGEVKFGETIKELDLGNQFEAIGDFGKFLGDGAGGILEGGGGLIDGAGDAIGNIIGGDKDKETEGSEGEEEGGLLEDLNPF
ncbi:MAG: hypothetical protein AAGB26_12200 [Planctomycetota bacterium]